MQVFIDANGQLGTLTPPIASGSGTTAAPLALEQKVQAQQVTIGVLQETSAELRARLARLEVLAMPGARRRP